MLNIPPSSTSNDQGFLALIQSMEDSIDKKFEALERNIDEPLNKIIEDFPVTNPEVFHDDSPNRKCLENYLRQLYLAFTALTSSWENMSIPWWAEYKVNSLLYWWRALPDGVSSSIHCAIFKIFKIPGIQPSQNILGQWLFTLLKRLPMLCEQAGMEERALKLFIETILKKSTETELLFFLIYLEQEFDPVFKQALSACSDKNRERIPVAIGKAIQDKLKKITYDSLCNLPQKLRILMLEEDCPQPNEFLSKFAEEIESRIPKEQRLSSPKEHAICLDTMIKMINS